VNDLRAFAAKQAVEPPVPVVQLQETSDADFHIPSLEELGLSLAHDSGSRTPPTAGFLQPDSPAEVLFEYDEAIVIPSTPPLVMNVAPPPSPPPTIRLSPVLKQTLEEELPELAGGGGGDSGAAQTEGNVVVKKKKKKLVKRAKAPAPGMRMDEDVPEWMTAQTQQQSARNELPSIPSGYGGGAAVAALDWAMVRKTEHQKDDEGGQEPALQSPEISVLPSASQCAAAPRDSDLGGWQMVRKLAPSCPPAHQPPPPAQQLSLVEISDGQNVLRARDVEGGYFVRRSSGAAKAIGVLDTSMGVEDYDE
jgi:hypothetical protein